MTDQGKAIEWDVDGEKVRLYVGRSEPEALATPADLEAAGFIRKPTPEKAGPAETAGDYVPDDQPQRWTRERTWRCAKCGTSARDEMICCGPCTGGMVRAFASAQPAALLSSNSLTRLEDLERRRVADVATAKELLTDLYNRENEADEVLLGHFIEDNLDLVMQALRDSLRAQPPLASSVVADEATTGEGDDLDIQAGGRGLSLEQIRLLYPEAVRRAEPSPLTGEERKAERVDYEGLAYVRAALKNSSQASRDGAADVAFRELRIAVRRIAEMLESRAAKGESA